MGFSKCEFLDKLRIFIQVCFRKSPYSNQVMMCFNVRFSMQMLLVDVNFLSLKCSSLGHSSSSSYVLVKSDLPTQVSQFGEHCVTHCVLLQPEPIKGECAHHVTLVKPIKSEKLPKTTTEEQSERRRRENTTHTHTHTHTK